MRRPLLLGLAVGAAAVAVFLLALAIDVVRWERDLAAADVRFRTAPHRTDLWQPPSLVPFGTARTLLDVRDDLEFRRAVSAFRRGRPREYAQNRPDLLANRTEAQLRLTQIARADRDARRRSAASNLLGVLSVGVGAREDSSRAATFFTSGVASFQTAIDLDARNEEAKFNLELTLRRLNAVRPSLETAGAERARRRASQAGLKASGSGY